jgi:copper(I)-binding protein
MTSVLAHEFKLGDIKIAHPYARATVPQQSTGGAYLGLENTGKTDDKLLKVESTIARSVEIHSMEMVGDVMKMREVDGIDIKAGSKISMKPGDGYHIMLIGLQQQLKAGDKFPMTLVFAKAGKIDVVVVVEPEPAAH